MKKLLAPVIALVLVTACSKQESSEPEVGSNPLNAPAEYLGAVNQAQKTAVRQIDLASIKKAIELFQVQEERYPKDLNELVAKNYLPVLPEPPAGSQIKYNPQTGEVTITR